MPRGVVARWEVAPADREMDVFSATDVRLIWQQVQTEENGVLNISRLYPASAGRVFVRTTVVAPSETTAALRFGFSDRLVLAVNGEKMYEGTCLWNPPVSDGRVRLDFAALGRNKRDEAVRIRQCRTGRKAG